ncbi:hypothetical protein OsJ_21523 [Oryza sativa Japonica Group]|uniref:DUF7722 domain-containing protein n=1 Tax=Oryza sativa subsp. japonica TaxID=39947 RepID=A3BC93_ORYSJ|nr:hypothetical protein OsJ_21523 [Oryza sativa Japonica Group]
MAGGGQQPSTERKETSSAFGGGCCGGGFQMPLHYPRYKKADYEAMPEWRVDCLLRGVRPPRRRRRGGEAEVRHGRLPLARPVLKLAVLRLGDIQKPIEQGTSNCMMLI